MRKLFLLAIAVTACWPIAAAAQIETVVVTAERRGYGGDAPGVTLVERADHLVTKVKVTCDTRDPVRRTEELRLTLRDMIAQARHTGSISLSIGDEVLYEFTEESVDKTITADTRADTSSAYIVIRTELSKTDTFEAAAKRIQEFILHTPKTGRTEILIDEPYNLGLMNPERYRAELVAKVAEDSKHTAALFGAGYQVRVEGLQRAVQWFQSGKLDLSLYIPYGLVISPNGAP
jgi:hypothetical protein